MNRKIDKDQPILIATHNPGKANEFMKLFKKYSIKTLFSADLNLEEPEETGKTFQENSELKAKSALLSNLTVVADDSGLCVDALDNQPGIYSARWAKKYGGWENSMKEIYRQLVKKKEGNLRAKYCCSLSIAWKDGYLKTYYGEIKGKINWPPKGLNGFGYDPIFIPEKFNKTFGEITKEQKMNIDHRSKAFAKLIKNHFEK